MTKKGEIFQVSSKNVFNSAILTRILSLAPIIVASEAYQPIAEYQDIGNSYQNMTRLHYETRNNQTNLVSAQPSLQHSSLTYQMPSCPPQSQNLDLPPPSYNDVMTQLPYKNPNFNG